MVRWTKKMGFVIWSTGDQARRGRGGGRTQHQIHLSGFPPADGDTDRHRAAMIGVIRRQVVHPAVLVLLISEVLALMRFSRPSSVRFYLKALNFLDLGDYYLLSARVVCAATISLSLENVLQIPTPVEHHALIITPSSDIPNPLP